MNVSKLALLSLSIISPICAMQISNESLMAPYNIGKIKLYRDAQGFTLKQNKELHSIASHDVDPLLRKANSEQLKEFLKSGYIKVKQANNGEFSLSSHTRGLGGGALFAYWGYWATKGLIYGTLTTAAAASTGVVVAAAGSGIIATSVGAGVTNLIGSGAALSLAPATASAIAGTAVTTGVGTATVATGATAAVVATTGFNAAAIVTGIEIASASVAALLSVPWLP